MKRWQVSKFPSQCIKIGPSMIGGSDVFFLMTFLFLKQTTYVTRTYIESSIQTNDAPIHNCIFHKFELFICATDYRWWFFWVCGYDFVNKELPLNLFNTFKISSATLADLMFSGLSFLFALYFASWTKNRVRICFVHLPPNFFGGLLFFQTFSDGIFLLSCSAPVWSTYTFVLVG